MEQYKFKGYTVELSIHPFGKDKTKHRLDLIDVEDGCPVTTLNYYFDSLQEGEIAVKDGDGEGSNLRFLYQNNIISSPHRYIQSGYISVPVCKLLLPINKK
jgi:hypothetical protein